MDAEDAIKKDESYVKGYYRKGQALFALRKYKDAKASFQKVIKLQPKDKDARERFEQCNKEIKRILFEKAIETEEEDPFKDLHIDSMNIDKDYSGPHIKQNGIDSEFVIEMIEHFKNQKKIPLKYLYYILIKSKEILEKSPNVVEIDISANGIASINFF
jgi:serine/threonine-protein phosphatase 5